MQNIFYLVALFAVLAYSDPERHSAGNDPKANIIVDTLLPFAFPDKQDTAGKNLSIDSLKPGQRYFINVESTGCFHNTKIYLAIGLDSDGYYASFKMRGTIEQEKVNAKPARTRLQSFQLDSLRRFEKQLRSISTTRGHCTTVDSYHLRIGNVQNVYTVDDCEWKGIAKLVDFLFKKPGEYPR